MTGMGDTGSSFTGWAYILLLFAGVIIPIVIAYSRGVANKTPTILLSVLLGWTCLGAIVPLIVSVTAKTDNDMAKQAFMNAAALDAIKRQSGEQA